jgi:N6-adenosine-specific RNA methylase IME4
MRKIEQLTIQAIKAKRNWTNGNTSVTYQPEVNTTERACIEYSKVFLHGNHIATYCHGLDRWDYNPMTLTQWPTPTTKSRLRALGFDVRTVKGHTFVGDRKIV